jgi:CopG family nickel-responsive transcriptional regulator
MQRVTVTLDEELLAEVDKLTVRRGYQNRSEAVRDLARAGLQQAKQEATTGDCVAALVYVYDHGARDLSKKLTRSFHDHHDLALATLHVHLDDESCMEVTALKGASAEVQHFADHIIAERGVRYGKVVVIPSEKPSEKRRSMRRGYRHHR